MSSPSHSLVAFLEDPITIREVEEILSNTKSKLLQTKFYDMPKQIGTTPASKDWDHYYNRLDFIFNDKTVLAMESYYPPTDRLIECFQLEIVDNWQNAMIFVEKIDDLKNFILDSFENVKLLLYSSGGLTCKELIQDLNDKKLESTEYRIKNEIQIL